MTIKQELGQKNIELGFKHGIQKDRSEGEREATLKNIPNLLQEITFKL
jgi:hypothetical protein